MVAGVFRELVLLLHLGLVTSRSSYTGSVTEVISGWIHIESVIQVIFDVQGVSLSNLLPDMVRTY